MHWLVQQDLDRAGSGQDNLFRDVPLTSATEGWRRVNFLYPDRPTVSILIDEIDSYLAAIQRGDGKWLKFSDRPIPLPADHPAVESMDVESSYIDLTRGFIRYYIRSHLCISHYHDLSRIKQLTTTDY